MMRQVVLVLAFVSFAYNMVYSQIIEQEFDGIDHVVNMTDRVAELERSYCVRYEIESSVSTDGSDDLLQVRGVCARDDGQAAFYRSQNVAMNGDDAGSVWRTQLRIGSLVSSFSENGVTQDIWAASRLVSELRAEHLRKGMITVNSPFSYFFVSMECLETHFGFDVAKWIQNKKQIGSKRLKNGNIEVTYLGGSRSIISREVVEYDPKIGLNPVARRLYLGDRKSAEAKFLLASSSLFWKPNLFQEKSQIEFLPIRIELESRSFRNPRTQRNSAMEFEWLDPAVWRRAELNFSDVVELPPLDWRRQFVELFRS